MRATDFGFKKPIIENKKREEQMMDYYTNKLEAVIEEQRNLLKATKYHHTKLSILTKYLKEELPADFLGEDVVPFGIDYLEASIDYLEMKRIGLVNAIERFDVILKELKRVDSFVPSESVDDNSF